MSERRGIWSLLSYPTVYEALHHAIGARRWMRRFVSDVLSPLPNHTIIDIGCGTGALLSYLPQPVDYTGFDYNRSYIEQAQSRHGTRGRFICDDIGNFSRYELRQADLVVAIGVMHHLDDILLTRILRDVVSTLRAGGRFIAVDPCFHPEQNAVQRIIVSNDRGTHVRAFDEYLSICKTVFPNAGATFRKGMWPPHSVCIIEARNGPYADESNASKNIPTS